MTTTPAAIPRLYCWGLIEALRSNSIRRNFGFLFPGFIAGASLKQRTPFAAHVDRHLFPGFIAGASLKPLVRPADDARGGQLFPGFIAGASLKRSHWATRFKHKETYSPALLLGPH